MKTKTIYIVLGIASVGGAWWYYKNKQSTSPIIDQAVENGGVIPLPASEQKKIIKLPDSLLVNTTGNTGVVPPVLSMEKDSVKIAQPLSTRTSTILRSTSLKGYILN